MKVFAFRREKVEVLEFKTHEKIKISPKALFAVKKFDYNKPITIILLQDDSEEIIKALREQVLNFANAE